MKKISVPKMILNASAFLVLLATALSGLFKWEWSFYLLAVFYLATGIFLLGEGGWGILRKHNFGGSKKFAKGLHITSFAFGLLFVYVGIVSFPMFGILGIESVRNVTGWITLIGSVTAIAEMFVR